MVEVKMMLMALTLGMVVLSGFLQKLVPPPKPKIVGIDLGTTHSSIGLFLNGVGTTWIIPDSQNRSLFPSMVAFCDGGRVKLGYEALEQQEQNPNRTIFDAKRFIGKQFVESSVQRDLKLYPYPLVEGKGGRVAFQLSDRLLYPEEVSALLLQSLKERAEKAMGSKFSEVVLAVPVEFTASQRNFTVEAARLAGLKVLRMISEPTAAAIAYGLNAHKPVSNIIVFDFGGGTLDVSLLYLESNVFEVIAVSGDDHLGGEDFNHLMLQYYLNLLMSKYGADLPRLSQDKDFTMKLRREVERMKIELSDAMESKLEINWDWGTGTTTTFSDIMTREKFEEISIQLFDRILSPVKDVLKEGNLEAKEIEDVVLVGGSTRIPLVRKILHQFFGFEPNTSVDPDIAVTVGAATQAGILGDSWPVPIAAVEKPFRRAT